MKHRHRVNQARWDAQRLKGRRLPTLAERLDDRRPLGSLACGWYDGRVRWLQVSNGTALWYRSGQPATAAHLGLGAITRPVPATGLLLDVFE